MKYPNNDRMQGFGMVSRECREATSIVPDKAKAAYELHPGRNASTKTAQGYRHIPGQLE